MSITAMKQALEALERAVSTCFDRRAHEDVMSRPEHFINQTITALRAALAEPVPHGCHVDLEEGMDPDGCVLDEGRPSKCIYARCLVREGKGKTDCEYWQPIEVKR